MMKIKYEFIERKKNYIQKYEHDTSILANRQIRRSIFKLKSWKKRIQTLGNLKFNQEF